MTNRVGIVPNEPESTSDLDIPVDPPLFTGVIEMHAEDVRAIGLATFAGIRDALSHSGSHLEYPLGKVNPTSDFEKDVFNHLILLRNFPIRSIKDIGKIDTQNTIFSIRKPIVELYEIDRIIFGQYLHLRVPFISNDLEIIKLTSIYVMLLSILFTIIASNIFIIFLLIAVIISSHKAAIINYLDYNKELVPGLRLYEIGNIEKLCAIGVQNPELVDLTTYIRLRIATLESSTTDMQEDIDDLLSYDKVCTYTAEEFAEIHNRLSSNRDILANKEAEIKKLKLELARLEAIKTEIEKLKVESAKLLLSFQDEIKSLKFNLIFFQQTTNYSSKTENEIQIQAQMEKIANKVKESEENISKTNAEIARLQSMLHPIGIVDFSQLDRLNAQMNVAPVQTDLLQNLPRVQVEQAIDEQKVELNSVVAATSAK